MAMLSYLHFDALNPSDFLPLLNNPDNRKHLIEHTLFTADSAKAWLDGKIAEDAIPGCRVRAILCDRALAGWCAIQFQNGEYEMAIMLDKKFWGLGRQVFHEMMAWADELRHDQLVIHFLHTRPEYKFLQKIASKVYETEIFGETFTSYKIDVEACWRGPSELSR